VVDIIESDKLYIKNKSLVNFKDQNKNTALHMLVNAAKTDSFKKNSSNRSIIGLRVYRMWHLLVDDYHFKPGEKNKQGETAYEIASRNDDLVLWTYPANKVNGVEYMNPLMSSNNFVKEANRSN